MMPKQSSRATNRMLQKWLLSTAVPFLIEHKLSGELLGLSDILSVDCFDYLRTIMFDLKVTVSRKIGIGYSLGYALVLKVSMSAVDIAAQSTWY